MFLSQVKVNPRPKLRMLRTKTSLNDVVFVSMSTVLHDLFNFFKQKKIRKATFSSIPHYWHPKLFIPALHRTLVLHGHVYNYTRLCGILLSFPLSLSPRPSLPQVFFIIFFFFFRLLIFFPPHSIPTSTTTYSPMVMSALVVVVRTCVVVLILIMSIRP